MTWKCSTMCRRIRKSLRAKAESQWLKRKSGLVGTLGEYEPRSGENAAKKFHDRMDGAGRAVGGDGYGVALSMPGAAQQLPARAGKAVGAVSKSSKSESSEPKSSAASPGTRTCRRLAAPLQECASGRAGTRIAERSGIPPAAAGAPANVAAAVAAFLGASAGA